MGRLKQVVQVASVRLGDPAPAVVALTDDSFAVAWSDFNSDKDELGVRLAKVKAGVGVAPVIISANKATSFSQWAPDVAFDGSKIVVAWVDDSNPTERANVNYRTFDKDLAPLSDEESLAATPAVEDHVVLAGRSGAWAAAWRSGHDNDETLEVESGSSHWSVGPYGAGAGSDLPALSFIDANHLALAFTAVEQGSENNGQSLRVALLDRAFAGHVESFPISEMQAMSAVKLAPSSPSLLTFHDRALVAWQAPSVPGSAFGDELWQRAIGWSYDGQGHLLVDASAPAVELLPAALRGGDQSLPGLASTPAWPEHRTFVVWDDQARNLGSASGVRDVGLSVTVTPRTTCEAVSVTTSENSPVTISDLVTITAAGACPVGLSPQFRFGYVEANSSNYTYFTGWSEASSASWNTSGLSPGYYDLIVFVRSTTSSGEYDSLVKKTLKLIAPAPCNVTSLATNPNGPVPESTVLAISAMASCASGANPSFRFAYALTETSNYTYLTDWGPSAAAVWNTSGLASANYDVVAFVRPSTAVSGHEGIKTLKVGVRSRCAAGSLTTTPTVGGAVITLAGLAVCRDPQFSYFYAPEDDQANWTLIGSPWVSGSAILSASAIAAGTYILKMSARELSFGDGDTSATIRRQIGPRCYGMNGPYDNTGHPLPLGEPIDVSAEAACEDGGAPEYAFFYKPSGATQWLQFPNTGWQTGGTGVLDTSGFVGGGMGYAVYDVEVRARGIGHVGFGEIIQDARLLLED